MTVSFTPHLMPFSRGMEADIYVKLTPGVTADQLREHLAKVYADETFVCVLPKVSAKLRPCCPEPCSHLSPYWRLGMPSSSCVQPFLRTSSSLFKILENFTYSTYCPSD